MARPHKQGVDYFPLDCHMNDGMKLIEAEFGLVGFGIVVKLWQKIYSGKGYYTEWARDVALVFAKDNSVGANVVHEVVRACFSRGIFDQGMYKRFGILTSEGVQERYFKATERRSFEKIDRRYLLITIPSDTVSADNNSVFVDNNATNKSKVNKSKVYCSTARDARASEKSNQGSFGTDEFFDAAVRKSLGGA